APTARVLSGRRESNGRATVSAGHHSAAPGYQAAAVASPGPAAGGGQLAEPPAGPDSPLGGRNGHAPAPAGPGAADPGGAGQAGSASQAAGAGAAETGGAVGPAPHDPPAADAPAAAAPAPPAAEPDAPSAV